MSLLAPRATRVMSRLQRMFTVFLSILLAAMGLLTSLPAYGQEYAFSFTAVGDMGESDSAGDVLNLIVTQEPAFHVLLGDIAYEAFEDTVGDATDLTSEDAWCSWAHGFLDDGLSEDFPFQLLAGNHDDATDTGDNFNRIEGLVREGCFPDRLDSTGTYGKEYYFDYPPAPARPLMRMILISPNLGFDEPVEVSAGEGSETTGDAPGVDLHAYRYENDVFAHRQFLDAAINSARIAGIPWIVVGMHKTCITTGDKDCSESDVGNAGVGEELMSYLVEDKHVDLILQAHDHNYQRSRQLTCVHVINDAGDSPSSTCTVDDEDNEYTKGSGTLLAIVGTGGKDFYDVSSSDLEAGYFAATNDSTYGVAKISIAEDELRMDFIPTTAGGFEDSFQIVGATEAVGSSPVDTVLVLDRSGSMNDPASLADDPPRKIEALQFAANAYVDAFALHSSSLVGAVSDGVGMVKYNTIAESYLDLDDLNDPAHFALVRARLSTDAINDESQLGPDGWTAIGDGMLLAAPMFTDPGRPHVMVVFSDGNENEGTPALTALAEIDDDPQLRIYTVALGIDEEEGDEENNVNRALMEDIATGGYFQISEDTREAPLELMFFKVFAEITEMDFETDPTAWITLGTEPVFAHRSMITSSDHQALFMVVGDPAFTDFYDVELITPDGTIVRPNVERYTYKLYRVDLPQVPSSPYVGEWKVQVRAKPGHEGSVVPVSFAAAVKSDYHMDVQLPPLKQRKGKKNFFLTVELREKFRPISDAKVLAKIWDGKHTEEVAFYDDGRHGDRKARDGIFGALFAAGKPGTYRLLVESTGKNAKGEHVRRALTRFIHVSDQKTPGRPLLIVIVGLAVLLLVGLLWRKRNA